MSDNFETKVKEDGEEDTVLDTVYDCDNKIVITNPETKKKLEFLCGDLEKKKVTFYDQSSEIIWVSPISSKSTRKVFIQILVKRVSDIDNVEEQYRMKFIINYYWIAQEAEYKRYVEHCRKNKEYQYEPSFSFSLYFRLSVFCLIYCIYF